MKNSILFIATLLLCHCKLTALPYTWGKTLSPKSFYGESTTNGIKYDNGYIYVYGSFKDTIDLDPGASNKYVTSYTTYAQSGFLAKFDLLGNMIWGGSLVGIKTGNPNCPAPPYNTINDIAFDANHNIYITGNYDDSVRFEFNGNTLGLKCPCGVSSYVVKLSPSGADMSAHHVTGMSCPTYFNGTSITIKGQSLYTLTEFHGEADFDFSAGSSIYSNTNYSNFQVVAARYNLNTMALEWSGKLESTSSLYAAKILVDNNNNMYVTGKVNGTMDVDLGAATNTITSQDTNSLDYFVIKYNASGTLQWVNQFTRPSSFDLDVIMDNGGHLVLAGGFKDNLNIKLNGTIQYSLNSLNAAEDILVAKLDQNGNTLWAKRIGGTYTDYFQGISASPTDDILVTGWFNVGTSINPSSTTNDFSVTGYATNGLMSCLSSSGNFLYGGVSNAYENPNNMNIGGSIYRQSTWDAAGNLYLCGRIIWTADVNPDTSMSAINTLTNTNNNFNTFVMKLGNAANPNAIGHTELNKDIQVYPNPAKDYVIIESTSSDIQSLALYSLQGQCVFATKPNSRKYRINVDNIIPGQYILFYNTTDNIQHTSSILKN